MTGTSSSGAALPSPAATPRIMPLARHQLGALRNRARRGIGSEALGVVAAMFCVYAITTYAVDRTLRLEVPFRVVLLATFVVAVMRVVQLRLLLPLRQRLTDEEMALAVERQAPGLRQALISSMQFEQVLDRGRSAESAELMRAVVTEVRGRFAELPFAAAIDARRVRKFTAMAATVLMAFVGWGIVDGGSLRLWAMRNLTMSAVEWPRYTKLTFLGATAGTLRLPQNDPLTVRVGVGGTMPDQVFLRTRFASGETGIEPMSRTGEGEFTLTLETLIEDVDLVAEGGDGISEQPLHIVIVERPRIESVSIQVVFPDYMHKEPEVVPETEGEVRLLRGSGLRLAARSHKPIGDAFALFDDQKLPLTRDADGHAFHGEFAPGQSGLLLVDVIDADQLGAGAPPRLLVRVVDDRPPTIDFRLRGISSMVTPQVRIPGSIEVKDDFGVTAVRAALRVVDDSPERQPQPRPDEPAPPESPFTPIDVVFAEALSAGAVRYETTASVDVKPLQRSEKDEDPVNPVRPGMLLSLRFEATDNFGPGDPHVTIGEAMSFRVVTREKLVDELRRRQIEQRLEVQRIRDDELAAQLALTENPNPSVQDLRPRQQLKALAARQQSLGRRTALAADLYQRILWEYENNRIWEPSKVREYEGLTAVPLLSLAQEPFPKTAHAVATFADAGDEELRVAALAGYKDIVARLDAIIQVMEQVETLAALIEQLRGVINVEDRAIREVERRLNEAGQNTFGAPRKGK